MLVEMYTVTRIIRVQMGIERDILNGSLAKKLSPFYPCPENLAEGAFQDSVVLRLQNRAVLCF